MSSLPAPTTSDPAGEPRASSAGPAPAADITPDQPFRVADWTVDAPGNRLLRAGETVQLEPRVMRLLVHLARNPGRVVSRAELEREVWSGMVVGYDAITNAVIKLRRGLGDDSRAPRLIETVSKHGYRLIAAVETLPPGALGGSGDTGGVPPTLPPAPREGPRRRPIGPPAALAGLALVLVIAAIALLRDLAGPERPAAVRASAASIAVLPLRDASADRTQGYFAAGLTEDLITELAKVPGLEVVARGSVAAYQALDVAPERIGRELGVAFVLVGSVRRDDGQLRLNVRLVDATNGRTLWAERYDRELAEVFRLQDELAARIAGAMELELAPTEGRRGRSEAASVPAYDALLRGLDYYGRRSLADNALAKQHYQRAIELDPDYGRAYAALAQAYFRGAVDGWDPAPRPSLRRAAALAEQAMRLTPGIPQVYLVRAQLALFEGRHADAIRETERASALAPGYADAYALQAWILHFAGRPARGREVLERAIRLNPRVPSIYRLVRAALHYEQGNHDAAIEDLEAAVEMSPNFLLVRLWLAAAYAGAERIEEARWQAAEAMSISPEYRLARVRELFPIRDPDYQRRFLADLAKAGFE